MAEADLIRAAASKEIAAIKASTEALRAPPSREYLDAISAGKSVCPRSKCDLGTHAEGSPVFPSASCRPAGTGGLETRPTELGSHCQKCSGEHL